MAKKTNLKPNGSYRIREEVPSMQRVDTGLAIMCPFCKPAHNLTPGQISPCGTILKLTAVQTIIPARLVRIKKLVCIKCRQGGGEMVPWHNGAVHLQECDPETKVFTAPPEFSSLARVLYGMPMRLQMLFAGRRGIPRPVKEITPDGDETGRILGYTFYKGA